METVATLSSKGQITLPASMRRALHIRTGDRLRVVQKGQSITIAQDSYEADLAKLRAVVESKLKSNGTWGTPYEQARIKTDELKIQDYKAKHDVRA